MAQAILIKQVEDLAAAARIQRQAKEARRQQRKQAAGQQPALARKSPGIAGGRSPVTRNGSEVLPRLPLLSAVAAMGTIFERASLEGVQHASPSQEIGNTRVCNPDVNGGRIEEGEEEHGSGSRGSSAKSSAGGDRDGGSRASAEAARLLLEAADGGASRAALPVPLISVTQWTPHLEGMQMGGGSHRPPALEVNGSSPTGDSLELVSPFCNAPSSLLISVRPNDGAGMLPTQPEQARHRLSLRSVSSWRSRQGGAIGGGGNAAGGSVYGDYGCDGGPSGYGGDSGYNLGDSGHGGDVSQAKGVSPTSRGSGYGMGSFGGTRGASPTLGDSGYGGFARLDLHGLGFNPEELMLRLGSSQLAGVLSPAASFKSADQRRSLTQEAARKPGVASGAQKANSRKSYAGSPSVVASLVAAPGPLMGVDRRNASSSSASTPASSFGRLPAGQSAVINGGSPPDEAGGGLDSSLLASVLAGRPMDRLPAHSSASASSGQQRVSASPTAGGSGRSRRSLEVSKGERLKLMGMQSILAAHLSQQEKSLQAAVQRYLPGMPSAAAAAAAVSAQPVADVTSALLPSVTKKRFVEGGSPPETPEPRALSVSQSRPLSIVSQPDSVGSAATEASLCSSPSLSSPVLVQAARNNSRNKMFLASVSDCHVLSMRNVAHDCHSGGSGALSDHRRHAGRGRSPRLEPRGDARRLPLPQVIMGAGSRGVVKSLLPWIHEAPTDCPVEPGWCTALAADLQLSASTRGPARQRRRWRPLPCSSRSRRRHLLSSRGSPPSCPTRAALRRPLEALPQRRSSRLGQIREAATPPPPPPHPGGTEA